MGCVELFGKFPDPRWRNARRDPGKICLLLFQLRGAGAETAVDMAEIARSRLDAPKQALKLEHRPPNRLNALHAHMR